MFQHADPPAGDIPPEAYQLADHLDAALAAAEDLVIAGRAWPEYGNATETFEIVAHMAAERQVIERVMMFEAAILGRVFKARKRAAELTKREGTFAGMTRLFLGGTAILVDAVHELADSTRSDFDTATDRLAYLRQRGVIASDAADLPEDRMITFGDDFLVAGRVRLDTLVEMIISFIDALESHFDLYPDSLPSADTKPVSWAEILSAARLEAEAHEWSASHSVADTYDAGADMVPGPRIETGTAMVPVQSGDETLPACQMTDVVDSAAKANSLIKRLEMVSRSTE